MGKDSVGADEFVMDSYKIRQGKFSILQLEGQTYDELSPTLLCEYQDVIQDGDVLYIAVFHPTRSDIAAAMDAIGLQSASTSMKEKSDFQTSTPSRSPD